MTVLVLVILRMQVWRNMTFFGGLYMRGGGILTFCARSLCAVGALSAQHLHNTSARFYGGARDLDDVSFIVERAHNIENVLRRMDAVAQRLYNCKKSYAESWRRLTILKKSPKISTNRNIWRFLGAEASAPGNR